MALSRSWLGIAAGRNGATGGAPRGTIRGSWFPMAALEVTWITVAPTPARVNLSCNRWAPSV